MSWAVIITLPFVIPLAIYYFLHFSIQFESISTKAWMAITYLAMVSQSLGMFLWFRVLAKGPMEKVALIQLLQPFLTLMAAILFLDEKVLWSTWIIALFVAVCIFGANNEKTKSAI